MNFYIGGGGGGSTGGSPTDSYTGGGGGGSTGGSPTDSYTGGGGGGSTGGLPTGWDTGSPGVTGGSGGSTPSGGLSVSPNYAVNGTVSNIISTPDILKTTSMYVQNLQVSYLNALQKGDSTTASNYLKEINSIASNPYGFVSPYANFKAPVYNSPGALPDAELGLLSEYGNDVSNLYGTTYKGTDYTGTNRQSSYDAWYNAEQAKFAEAKSKPSADLPIELAKPFMPNGAPKADDADLKLRVGDALARENGNQPVGLSPYSPLKSDWKGSYQFLGLYFPDKSNPFLRLASQYDSPSFTGSGLLAQTMVKGMEGADPQRNSSNPWQSTNLIKPASYFDEGSQGIAPPKGLMGQDMITQNNVLPALQMALMNSQSMPEGNEALDAATKPLSDAKDKGNATDKIQEARNKWKSDSLNKFGNWQSLA